MKKAFVLFLILLSPLLARAAPVQWAANGHWYEMVLNPAGKVDIGWSTAKALAESYSHAGSAGYLATITSAEENAFVTTMLAYHWAWLGGTDAGSEGSWYWATGPEAGQAFTYTSWADTEPNNYLTEQYLMTGWSGPGLWNDLAPLGKDIYPGVAYFIVEYGGTVPEPATAWLVGSMLLALSWARRTRR